MPTVPHFPERLKYHRLRLQLSQAELGTKIGVSQNAIGTWERGESTPQIPELLALCSVFDLSVLYLTGLSDRERNVDLTPGRWLLDMDAIAKPQDDEDWCWQVPRRIESVSHREMEAIEAKVTKARRVAAKKGRSDGSS